MLNVVLRDSFENELSSHIKNIDVLLSSRASETTLLAIKSQLDKLSFDENNRLAIQDLPNLDVPLSTRASEETLTSIGTEIVYNLWQKIRYGRVLSELFWVYGSILTAPAANTSLVSYTVPSGRTAYIYGYLITGSAANQFEIRWRSSGNSRTIRIVFAAGGTALIIQPVAINEGLPADPTTTISIHNINTGASGSVFQAGLLIGIP